MQTPRSLIRVSALLAAAAVSPALAGDIVEGEGYFRHHCATCHGTDATGSGPMAGALLIQPSDLTALSAGNGGRFPTVRVVMRIDGRDPLVSHGSAMPVYGPFFQQGTEVPLKAEDGQPILTSAPIAKLVAYLQHIQEN